MVGPAGERKFLQGRIVLAEARKVRRNHAVVAHLEFTPDKVPAPSTVPCAMDENECRHVGPLLLPARPPVAFERVCQMPDVVEIDIDLGRDAKEKVSLVGGRCNLDAVFIPEPVD